MPEGETATTPVTEPTQAPQQVADHITQAAQSATQAATETGEPDWKVIAAELRGELKATKELMGKVQAPSSPESQAAPTSSPPAPPDVEVEKPKTPVRYVRRGRKKVKRDG